SCELQARVAAPRGTKPLSLRRLCVITLLEYIEDLYRRAFHLSRESVRACYEKAVGNHAGDRYSQTEHGGVHRGGDTVGQECRALLGVGISDRLERLNET